MEELSVNAAGKNARQFIPANVKMQNKINSVRFSENEGVDSCGNYSAKASQLDV
jgi:hypothetical protein